MRRIIIGWKRRRRVGGRGRSGLYVSFLNDFLLSFALRPLVGDVAGVLSLFLLPSQHQHSALRLSYCAFAPPRPRTPPTPLPHPLTAFRINDLRSPIRPARSSLFCRVFCSFFLGGDWYCAVGGSIYNVPRALAL